MSMHAHYITTAISYPNGKPHLGHAYEAVLADTLARHYRGEGKEVRFVTGTDEHGLKIFQKARDEGITPKELVDRESEGFKRMLEALSVKPDRFIRTTDEDHYAEAQKLWMKMVEAGDIYLDTYKGWYCVAEESYFDEDELFAVENGYVSPLGNPVEWKQEESWFFRLSKYQKQIDDAMHGGGMTIKPPSRHNEVRRMVEAGLRDISISRTTFDWGIPVPNSPGHVMYVWVDALANYLTGARDEYRNWWPASNHFIGKDILKFHAIYWPAFLMSAGLPIPREINAHGFWMNDGKKMSKSAGNVIDPHDLIDLYGSDQLRYYMLESVSMADDGNFSHEKLITCVDTDLVNSWGNLVQRTCSLISAHCDAWPTYYSYKSIVDDRLIENVQTYFTLAQFSNAIAEWQKGVYRCNQYIDAKAPWNLVKVDRGAAIEVLAGLLDTIKVLNKLIAPVVPNAAAKLNDYLNGPLAKPTVLFPRIGK